MRWRTTTDHLLRRGRHLPLPPGRGWHAIYPFNFSDKQRRGTHEI